MSVDELPHQSLHGFAVEKRKHLTDIRNSPARTQRRPEHPYEPMQPEWPHYSQVDFESEKRVHQTDVRQSPQRGRGKPEPPTCHHSPKHLSRREFAIEKSEHLTAILPEQKKRGPEVREPHTFKHLSHSQLAGEVERCKTTIYPVLDIPVKKGGIVDNYLNYRPHPKDFMHDSLNELRREKKLHLTAMHTKGIDIEGLRQKRSRSTETPDPSQRRLYASAQRLNRDVFHHRTDLGFSAQRARSSEPVDSRAPMYSSNGKFTSDKHVHRASISNSPRRHPEEPARQGYISNVRYTEEKRRHSLSPQPIPRLTAHEHRKIHDEHCGHESYVAFSSEKRKHATECHNSPPRDRSPQKAIVRSPSRQFTSRLDLEDAKHNHAVAVGITSWKPEPSDRKVASSVGHFTSEKRAHRTSVRNVHGTPDPPSPQDPPRYSSERRFSAAKRVHRADVAPPPGSVERLRVASASPARFTSYSQFRSDKLRHRVEIDSPLRALPTPPTPPSVRSHSAAYQPSVERQQRPAGRPTPQDRASDSRSRSVDKFDRVAADPRCYQPDRASRASSDTQPPTARPGQASYGSYDQGSNRSYGRRSSDAR